MTASSWSSLVPRCPHGSFGFCMCFFKWKSVHLISCFGNHNILDHSQQRTCTDEFLIHTWIELAYCQIRKMKLVSRRPFIKVLKQRDGYTRISDLALSTWAAGPYTHYSFSALQPLKWKNMVRKLHFWSLKVAMPGANWPYFLHLRFCCILVIAIWWRYSWPHFEIETWEKIIRL